MSPLKDPKTGDEIFPGYERGSELGWGRLLGGPDPYETALDTYKYVIFKNTSWDWRTFLLDRDFAEAIRVTQGLLTAVDPNLTPFAARGGKLLMYHGWADEEHSTARQREFLYAHAPGHAGPFVQRRLDSVVHGAGDAALRWRRWTEFVRLIEALESWVERGQAPASLLASHSTAGRVGRTRPLCPYPQVARYRGTGSIDDAANFVCAVSTQRR